MRKKSRAYLSTSRRKYDHFHRDRNNVTDVTIKVLHRTAVTGDRMMFYSNYEPGDGLTEVLKFESGFPACGSIERLLTIIFDQLNIDNPRADWAQQYRCAGNRSLSVGDVVIIGEMAYACERIGWKTVKLGK